jgi:hypothetical protein
MERNASPLESMLGIVRPCQQLPDTGARIFSTPHNICFRYTSAMATWRITTEAGERVVDCDGVRRYCGVPNGAWRYIAAHAANDDAIHIYYAEDNRPTVLTGGALRQVLAWTGRIAHYVGLATLVMLW